MLRRFMREWLMVLWGCLFVFSAVLIVWAQATGGNSQPSVVDTRTYITLGTVALILTPFFAGWKAWAGLQQRASSIEASVLVIAKSVETHCATQGAHRSTESLLELFVPAGECKVHHVALTNELTHMGEALQRIEATQHEALQRAITVADAAALKQSQT